jgi:hypothetical protein
VTFRNKQVEKEPGGREREWASLILACNIIV